jgi:hypothetical protein
MDRGAGLTVAWLSRFSDPVLSATSRGTPRYDDTRELTETHSIKRLQKLSKEVEALRSLDNSNLLPSSLLDTQGLPAGTLALTSPWMEQGNILDYLRRNASADKFRMVSSIPSQRSLRTG